jgi:hypothetical protein
MLESEHMAPVKAPTWIPDEDVPVSDEVVLTAAELAECSCPDPCECDHDS